MKPLVRLVLNQIGRRLTEELPGARATLYRRIQAGAFPAQVKISARCSAWRESEVEAWMRDPFGFANSLRDDA